MSEQIVQYCCKHRGFTRLCLVTYFIFHVLRYHLCLSLLFFSGKAVTVNGISVTLPKSYSGSGLILERVGMFVSLTSRLGVSLLWDGGTLNNLITAV